LWFFWRGRTLARKVPKEGGKKKIAIGGVIPSPFPVTFLYALLSLSKPLISEEEKKKKWKKGEKKRKRRHFLSFYRQCNGKKSFRGKRKKEKARARTRPGGVS